LLGGSALKLTEYRAELRREKLREDREKALRRRQRRRIGEDTDVRNRSMQAFRVMHVEAMNWSEMDVCKYAVALSLSPHALRKGVTAWTRARSKSTDSPCWSEKR
jgi:hypothetical protein